MAMRAGYRKPKPSYNTSPEILSRMGEIKCELGQLAIEKFNLCEEYKILNLKLDKAIDKELEI